MGGHYQATYMAPNSSVPAFLDDIMESGFLPSPSVDNEDGFLLLLKPDEYRFPPSLAFWSTKMRHSRRKVDLHWIEGQCDIARAVDLITRKHGWTTDDQFPVLQ